jgi:hypothetical protein
MIDELEGIWKEGVVAQLKYYPEIEFRIGGVLAKI